MPINTEQILQLITHLAKHEGLQVTVTETTKGVCIIGVSSFVGGIFGGPVGLMTGGIIGSIIVYARGRGKFKSVLEVIANDMTPVQRKKLADCVNKIVQDIGIEDITILFEMALSRETIKGLIIKEVARFIEKEMSLAMTLS